MRTWKAGKATTVAALVCTLIASLTLASCSAFRARFIEPGSWTVCIYLCGSNLESRQGWGSKTLDDLRSVRVPKNANVVVQVGGSKKWHDEAMTNGSRFIVEDHDLTAIGSVGDANMGESSTLADFLSFCANEYPAEHTAVVLWGHGGGPLAGVCYDEAHRFDALDLGELDKAFDAGVASNDGVPYDIVGFDACLMGTLEVASTLRDDAHWLVASEEIESGAGWDYKTPIRKLTGGADPYDVATAICDGYYKKCKKRGKEDCATVSAIDLSRVLEVEEALDAIVSKLGSGTETSTQALRHLSFGARYAESFGGETSSEGRSNLIDIKGLASGNQDAADGRGAAWEALVQAVDNSVSYKRCGPMVSDAGGISLWYPLVFDDKELRAYAEASPLSSYAAALTRLFATGSGAVSFSDPGSINKDGAFCASIDPATSDRFFDLYIENTGTGGSYRESRIDFAADWDNLTFSYDPSGASAIALDGMLLDTEVIAYDHGFVEFSAPITVDGKDMSLRVAWYEGDEEEDGGHYELLGVWDGVTHVTGVADRTEDTLPPHSTVGARSLETNEVRAEVVVGHDPTISRVPLASGRYSCCVVAIDLTGRTYRSHSCTYEIDADGNVTNMAIDAG